MLKNTLNKALLHVFNNRGKYIVSSGLIITATLLKNNKAIQSLYQNPVLIDEDSKHLNNLLEKANRLLENNNYNEAEKYYAEIAKLAQIKNDYIKMVVTFCQLAEIYIHYAKDTQEKLIDRQYSLIKATALYNCAVNIEREKLVNQGNTLDIQAKIIKVEEIFINLCQKTVNPYSYQFVNIKHKENLEKIRKEIKQRFEEIIKGDFKYKWLEEDQNVVSIQTLYNDITLNMIGFVNDLWRECLETIGEVPCKYSIIAFGSMARGEMTPYSDFEWGILLEDSNRRNKEYFKTLANLLYLKVVNLGETILPAINIKSLQSMDDYITPRGFAFDGQMSRACKTPFGKKTMYVVARDRRESGYELIGTPEELAQLQNEEWFEKDRLLPSELYQFVLIAGDEKLAVDYRQQTNTILNEIDKKDFDYTLRQKRALKLLKDDLETFNLQLGTQDRTEDGALYDVKKDLYRLPNTIFDDLGLYYGLQQDLPSQQFKNSWDKVDEIFKKKIGLFNKLEGVQNVKKALSISVFLRLQEYINSGRQWEYLSPLGSSHTELHANENHKILEEYYYIMLPFYKKVKDFCTRCGKSFLNEEIFFDDNHENKYLVYTRLYMYKEAKLELKTMLTAESNNVDILIKLGNICKDLNEIDDARAYFQKCLKCLEEKNSIDNHKLAIILCNIGMTFAKSNTLAQKYYLEKAYQLKDKLTPKEAAFVLNMYGCMLGDVNGNHVDKKNLLELALKYYENYEEKSNIRHEPGILKASILTNIGNVYSVLKKYEESLKYLKQALDIKEKHYGKGHPRNIPTTITLGNVYEKLGDPEKEKKLLEHAMFIQKKFYVLNDCSSAMILNNLGNAYGKLGNNSKRKELLEQALFILKALDIKNHDIVRTLYNLGEVNIDLGDNNKGTLLLHEALRFCELDKAYCYGLEKKIIKLIVETSCKPCEKLELKELEQKANKYNFEIHQRGMFFSQSMYATEQHPYGPFSDRLCSDIDPITILTIKRTNLTKRIVEPILKL
jgi:tetratricopeptide (TPR) repeat protein